MGDDWTYSQYRTAISTALVKGKDSVLLDTDDCTWRSNDLIKDWATKDGYDVKVTSGSVIIYFSKREGQV